MIAMHAQPETRHAPPVRRCSCGGIVGPTGECATCRAKRLAKDAQSRSAGAPLDARTRSSMERSFGHDFGSVRVHSDTAATGGIGARAFTIGTNIVTGSRGVMPSGLLAHELAHVVQQRDASTAAVAHRASPGAEAEASRAALSVLQGRPVGTLSSQPSAIARQDLDAGTPSDAGTTGDTGTVSTPERATQLNCVIRLGGCPNSRPGGIPTPEEITGYNAQCRRESTYSGSDITPTDEECGGTANPSGAAAAGPGPAMICSKRLEAPVAGWFANHSYIDDTGSGNCLSGGMLNNYAVQTLVSGNFLDGCAVKTDRSTDPQTYTPNAKPCNPAPGVTDVHACLRAAFNAYADPSVYSNNPRNSPWGPNSNTFAATLARACCADSTDRGLGIVPGWNHAPATPCPTATGGAAANEGAPPEGRST